MTQSELVKFISNSATGMNIKDVKDSVSIIMNKIAESISCGNRIEIRGFGAFSLRPQKPRVRHSYFSGKDHPAGVTNRVYFRTSGLLSRVLNDQS